MKKIMMHILSMVFLMGMLIVPANAAGSTAVVARNGSKVVYYNAVQDRFEFENVLLEEYEKALEKDGNVVVKDVEVISGNTVNPYSVVKNYLIYTSVPGPDFKQISIYASVNADVETIVLNGKTYLKFISFRSNSITTGITSSNLYTFSTTPKLTGAIYNSGATLQLTGSVQLETTTAISLGGSIHSSWFAISGSISTTCKCRSNPMSVKFTYNMPWIGVII